MGNGGRFIRLGQLGMPRKKPRTRDTITVSRGKERVNRMVECAHSHDDGGISQTELSCRFFVENSTNAQRGTRVIRFAAGVPCRNVILIHLIERS